MKMINSFMRREYKIADIYDYIYAYISELEIIYGMIIL